MPKYTVDLRVTVEVNSEQEARRYTSNQLLKGRWNEAKIVGIERQTSAAMQKYADDRGKRIKGRDITEDENTAICLENMSEW